MFSEHCAIVFDIGLSISSRRSSFFRPLTKRTSSVIGHNVPTLHCANVNVILSYVSTTGCYPDASQPFSADRRSNLNSSAWTLNANLRNLILRPDPHNMHFFSLDDKGPDILGCHSVWACFYSIKYLMLWRWKHHHMFLDPCLTPCVIHLRNDPSWSVTFIFFQKNYFHLHLRVGGCPNIIAIFATTCLSISLLNENCATPNTDFLVGTTTLSQSPCSS
jgi:hypothetical protein